MHTYQAREQRSKTTVNDRSYPAMHRGAAFHSTDHSSTPIVQARIQEMANNSSHVKQLRNYQQMANNKIAPVQKKENETESGLPGHIRSGVENLSGMDMGDVKVHYNSSKPAQLHALAYAQGTDIHVAPGQEKHLPHEAWHIVQQKQGRVQATTQAKGLPVNDNKNLEAEADVMKARVAMPSQIKKQDAGQINTSSKNITQLYTSIPRSTTDGEMDPSTFFPAFRSNLVHEVEETNDEEPKQERFVMKYIQGTTNTDVLNVSENGSLAINSDEESEHKTFFLSQQQFIKSSLQLNAVKSDFTLKPTGRLITVHNHPTTGEEQHLMQVSAKYKEDDEGAASELDSSCNVFYKNITKNHDDFQKLCETTIEEGQKEHILSDKRKALDQSLQSLELQAGDAFEIKGFGDERVQLGWNEHYAGIVAVDGPDQVTLEDYNRAFGDKIIHTLSVMFGDSIWAMQKKADEIRKKLFTHNDDWEEIPTTDLDLDTRNALSAEMEKLLSNCKEWISIMGKSREEKEVNFATHHFKMYGPAIKEQSFLDKWRGEMQHNQSTLSATKALRE